MATEGVCGWCGAAFPKGPHTQSKKFCCVKCRDTYWNAAKSKSVKRGEWRRRRFGEAVCAATPEQLAYIAGFFDGEGHIGIRREVRKANKSGYRYGAVLDASNTVREVLERIQAYLGGLGFIQCHATPSRRRFPNSKAIYRLRFSATEIRAILPNLMPWFVVKRRASDVVMRFLEAVDALPMRASRDHEVLDALWHEAGAINKRGR